jgi:uncharacterized protein
MMNRQRNVPLVLSLLLAVSCWVAALPSAAQTENAGPQTPARSYTGPIIDVHLHSYAADDYWGGAPNPATGQPAPATAREHLERSIEVMRQNNVVLGVTSGDALASAAAWREFAPDMVLRGLSMGDPEDFVTPEALRGLVERGEVEVLGEVGAQYVGLSPSDPAYSPYWAVAQDHGIPVAIHTGASFPGMPYRGRPAFRLRYGNPLLLEDMLVEFPDLKVYMMHAGGAGPYSEYALMMMSMYPQLHADVGVLSWMPGMEGVLETFLRQAQQMRMLNRVMFGSDQMVWPEAIGLAVERINAFGFLSVEEKADIFYNNAARFLGLSEEAIARHHVIASGAEGER